MTDDLKIMQWMFDCPPVEQLFNWPVGVERLAQYGKEVHRLSKSGESPEALADAWNNFAAGMGPNMTASIISTNHWRKLVPAEGCPKSNGDSSEAVVWSDGKRRVVARLIKDGDIQINVRFFAE